MNEHIKDQILRNNLEEGINILLDNDDIRMELTSTNEIVYFPTQEVIDYFEKDYDDAVSEYFLDYLGGYEGEDPWVLVTIYNIYKLYNKGTTLNDLFNTRKEEIKIDKEILGDDEDWKL